MKKGTKTLSVNSIDEPDYKYSKINVLIVTKVTEFSVKLQQQKLSF